MKGGELAHRRSLEETGQPVPRLLRNSRGKRQAQRGEKTVRSVGRASETFFEVSVVSK